MRRAAGPLLDRARHSDWAGSLDKVLWTVALCRLLTALCTQNTHLLVCSRIKRMAKGLQPRVSIAPHHALPVLHAYCGTRGATAAPAPASHCLVRASTHLLSQRVARCLHAAQLQTRFTPYDPYPPQVRLLQPSSSRSPAGYPQHLPPPLRHPNSPRDGNPLSSTKTPTGSALLERRNPSPPHHHFARSTHCTTSPAAHCLLLDVLQAALLKRRLHQHHGFKQHTPGGGLRRAWM